MLRALGLVVTVAALAVLGASCVDLMGLDGHAAALSELCTTLDACFGEDYYPDCRSHGDPRLAGAVAPERRAWLAMFAASGCLDTCAAARKCLDETPLCGPTADTCGQLEQCCGFTSGSGECRSGGCCKPDGIACADASECCLGDCSAPVGQSATFCGGFECLASGAACEENYQCCTGICIAGSCSQETCLPNGSDCTLNAECCEAQCAGAAPGAAGTCVAPSCTVDGQPCETPDDCCNGFCVESLSGEAVCSSGQCLPRDIKCVPGNNECCSGMCDAATGYCVEICERPGDGCAVDGDCCDGQCDEAAGVCGCYPAGAECQEHTDCCEGDCIDGHCGEVACAPVNTPCTRGDDTCCAASEGVDACQPNPNSGDNQTFCCDTASCAHSVCVEGGPLLPACGCANCGGSTAEVPAERCILSVCETLPHCCCFGWDEACREMAQARCGAVCAVIGVGGVEKAPPQESTPAP